MPGEPRGEVHQVADHAAQPPAFHWFAEVGFFIISQLFVFIERRLADHAQNVVGDKSERKHQGVRRELAARQAFQAEFRLQLRMKLFAGSVLVIKLDDIARRKLQAGPPCIHFNLGQKQSLAIGVNRATDDFEHHAIRLAVAVEMCLADEHFLAGPRLFALAERLGRFEPIVKRFAPEVPLDDVIGLVIMEYLQIPDGVVTGIHSHQQTFFRRLSRQLDRTTEELLRARLAVLVAGPKFAIDQVAFLSEIGEDRGIAIQLLISVIDAFLFCAAVIERRNVDIHRDISAIAGRYFGDMTSEHPRRFIMQNIDGRIAEQVEPLPERFLREQLFDSDRPGEEVFMTIGLDRRKAALAETEQPDHRKHRITVRDFRFATPGLAKRAESRPQIGLLQQCSGQCQARMRDKDVVGVRDMKLHENFPLSDQKSITRRVKPNWTLSSTFQPVKQGLLEYLSVFSSRNQDIVIGDNSAIQNALINLGINASQAMSDGGEIRIETKNMMLNEAYCDASPFEIQPGEYVVIEVRDTGCGIPTEDLRKIFEPFYTTKALGKGTGLGLAAVYGIVQDHQGAINVYSEIDKGTSFQILLPCSEEKAITSKINMGNGFGHRNDSPGR